MLNFIALLNPSARRARLLVLLAAVAAQACATHIKLAGPGPVASAEARIKAYEDLAPKLVQQTDHHNITVDPYGISASTIRTTDFVRLNNGTRVVHAQDLLPLVAADSKTAHFVHESEESWKTWRTASLVTVAAMVVGGAAVAVTGARYGNSSTDENIFFGTLGAVSVGTSIGAIVALVAGANHQQAKADAFAHYERDLRDTLRLCAQGKEIHPCELITTQAATAKR